MILKGTSPHLCTPRDQAQDQVSNNHPQCGTCANNCRINAGAVFSLLKEKTMSDWKYEQILP